MRSMLHDTNSVVVCGIVCRMFIGFLFFLSNCRSTSHDGEEERKLLQCLRKSVISPYKAQVVCLPSGSVVGPATSSHSPKTEAQSSASTCDKGLSLKVKPSPHRKTWTSPRRCTPRKHAVVKTRTSTLPRRTTHFCVDARKKAVATSGQTPNKHRSHTPRKFTKRTPAKGILTVDDTVWCTWLRSFLYGNWSRSNTIFVLLLVYCVSQCRKIVNQCQRERNLSDCTYITVVSLPSSGQTPRTCCNHLSEHIHFCFSPFIILFLFFGGGGVHALDKTG